MSTLAAKLVGSDSVLAFEANPHMAEIIERTYQVNGMRPTLTIGAIGPTEGELKLHIRKNFWSSSPHEKLAADSIETVRVPMYSLDKEIGLFRPTYLLIDIEGGEETLIGSSMLPGVKKLMTEVHPELIGQTGVRRFEDWISDLGFVKSEVHSRKNVLFFSRE
jgi:FkbM family methyltransferase